MQRVCIFIDGKFFHHGWKRQPRAGPVNWPKLSAWLLRQTGGTQLVGARYYTGIETGERSETRAQEGLRSFLSMLERQRGYSVHTSPRVPRSYACDLCHARGSTTIEKGVDSSIVVDLLGMALGGCFDQAVLLSGDADFVPVVEALADQGKRVVVGSWGGFGLSERLRTAAWDTIDLAAGARHFAPGGSRVGRRPSVPFIQSTG